MTTDRQKKPYLSESTHIDAPNMFILFTALLLASRKKECIEVN